MSTNTNDVTIDSEPQRARPKPIEITVNTQPVVLPDRDTTGLGVKQSAIDQGVAIDLGFQLSRRHGSRYEVIGDHDEIRVRRNDEFLAVAPDDNS